MLYSCQYELFVSKENVIKSVSGYLLVFQSQNYIGAHFLPMKYDTNLTFEGNMKKHPAKHGFHVHGIDWKSFEYIKHFGDTIYARQIPDVLQYMLQKEIIRKHELQTTEVYNMFKKPIISFIAVPIELDYIENRTLYYDKHRRSKSKSQIFIDNQVVSYEMIERDIQFVNMGSLITHAKEREKTTTFIYWQEVFFEKFNSQNSNGRMDLKPYNKLEFD